MTDAVALEAFQKTMDRLREHDFPERWRLTESLGLAPFQLTNKDNAIANPANLVLMLVLTKPDGKIFAGRLRSSLGWEMVRVKAVLNWGVRQGYLEQQTTNIYKVLVDAREVLHWEELTV